MEHRLKIKKTSRYKLLSTYESMYPLVFSVIVAIFYTSIMNDFHTNNLNDILNAIISFASIILGFIGVLVTLIFSLLQTEIIKTIFKDLRYKKKLKQFFFRSCQSGFIVITFSIIIYLRDAIIEFCLYLLGNSSAIYLFNIIRIFWVFQISYFLLTSYRVIALMIKIVFTAPIIEEESNSQDKVGINELRDKYSD